MQRQSPDFCMNEAQCSFEMTTTRGPCCMLKCVCMLSKGAYREDTVQTPLNGEAIESKVPHNQFQSSRKDATAVDKEQKGLSIGPPCC